MSAFLKNELAVVQSASGAGAVIAVLVGLLPMIVFAAASYWAYKKHQDMKTEGKETKIGMWSIICCATFACCGFMGTPLGLCFPIDEDNSKEEEALLSK